MPSYWATPFQKLCIGFKVNDDLKWLPIKHQATSLYDVIVGETYEEFSDRSSNKTAWQQLINGSVLQDHCVSQGFNLPRARLGIQSHSGGDCPTESSDAMGFGLNYPLISCGNRNRVNLKITREYAFGYILVH